MGDKFPKDPKTQAAASVAPDGCVPDRKLSNPPGPKTERGKANSSGNAIKLGLFSTRVVIESIDGEDAKERFAQLHNALLRFFAPEDPIAEFRVKRVAENLWRWQRIERGEAAMQEQSRLRAAQLDVMHECPAAATAMPNCTTAISTSARIRLLVDHLMAFEQELQSEGRLSGDSLNKLMTLFGSADTFAVECSLLCVTAFVPTPNGENPSVQAETNMKWSDQALVLITQKRQQLQDSAQRLEELQRLERQARLDDSCVPSQEDHEKLWRARAAISKELEQDLAHLDGNRPRSKKKMQDLD